MADKTQRPPQRIHRNVCSGFTSCYTKEEAERLFTKLEAKLSDVASLHADIIEQGRKVQIAASGESKYGAMSAGEYIEWMLNLLEAKQ